MPSRTHGEVAQHVLVVLVAVFISGEVLVREFDAGTLSIWVPKERCLHEQKKVGLVRNAVALQRLIGLVQVLHAPHGVDQAQVVEAFRVFAGRIHDQVLQLLYCLSYF